MQTYTVTVDKSSQVWRQNGLIHRLDGPAVIKADGTQIWYVDNKLHREDGPAAIYANGDCYWYQNDAFHRLDGPAIVYTNGDWLYYLNGRRYSKEDFDFEIAKRKSPCIGKVVEIDGVKYKLTAV